MKSKESNSNWIVKNLLGAVIFVLALSLCVSILLGVITQHGKYYKVPDFTGMSCREAASIAEGGNLHIVVTDSVFVPRMDRGAVFSQNPKPGQAVKSGRKISVIINAITPKTVIMPDLVGLSMRQAKSELDSRGLKLGKLHYVPDMATNNVLRQLCLGGPARPGSKVAGGSEIDLVVGLNESDGVTTVPDLKGMKYSRAVDVLKENSLNVGRVRFDKSVRTYADTLNSIVFHQSPEPPSEEEPQVVEMGAEVSLSLTLNQNKIPRP